ncbi:MAG: CRISPR-associated protein, Csx3 family [uncultured Thiotrichaceae bacterium]|uniref:CRISPR-associated protein, Csx3 family n=1 Tax=uncultured Thiotrichaceae bacterium TaxID=298394 RepID=A0A6S6TMA0_9GAMM|nr:MAG: CRISPR-associated protein, Csx3 family [uncultured Thiotrichaceae bacterium]
MKQQLVLPHHYSRRILLAVTGYSPQVMTETLYALSVIQVPPFIPTEVHLITTQEGRERAILSLLSDSPGWFTQLCEDYQLPEIDFLEKNIHLVRDPEGRVLDDIRTPQDNECAANAMTELIRDFTADPESAVHVSISGGRRTMTFYGGYALSLFGRTQDRLSHVLVTPDYEFLPDFFYPSPKRRIIYSRMPDSKPLDTAEAEVTLADIPFVRLRDGLPEALLAGEANFTNAVMAVQKELDPPSISVNIKDRELQCGSSVVKLPTASMAFYCWFVWRKVQGLKAVNALTADEQEYLTIYAALVGEHSGTYSRVEKALQDGFSTEYFEQRKSRMHTDLKKTLGRKADAYLLESVGSRPHTCFQIALDVSAIQWFE